MSFADDAQLLCDYTAQNCMHIDELQGKIEHLVNQHRTH
jgi:hypothetical protein